MTNLRVFLQNNSMAKVEDKTKEDKPVEEKTKSKPAVSTEEASEKAAAKSEDVKPEFPDVQPSTEAPPEIAIELETEKSSLISRKLLLLILAVLVVGGLVVGGIFFYRSRGATPKAEETDMKDKASQPDEEKPEVLEASPTGSITQIQEEEAAAVKLADYAVQVLNGSGIAGEAGNVKDLLEAEGFEKLDVGNADSYDYTDTEVRMKKNTPKEVFETIKSALKDYTVVEGDKLEEEKNDVMVIVGQKKE